MIRLDKMLSSIGLGSRSDVRTKIRSGCVTVNGCICKDASKQIDEKTDQVLFCGKTVHYQEVHTVLLNKPSGVLTAARDPKQPTVMDLLPKLYRSAGCMPAGRLDKDTTGLLIITNDGQLAHQIISPRHEVSKCYEAEVSGKLDDSDILAFQHGLHIQDADGTFDAKPARLMILTSGDETSVGRVVVSEGKYHQVKRMFASRGKEVFRLRRLSIGSLRIPEDLAEGEFLEINPEQTDLLFTDPSESFFSELQ